MDVKTLHPIIVGGGNLGGAVARGLFRAGIEPIVVELTGPNFDGLLKDGINAVNTIEEALPKAAGPIFVALKPWLMESYLAEHASLIAGRAVVSCAALIDLTLLQAAAPSARVGRIMTSIASAVGCGFTGIVKGSLSDEELATVTALAEQFGDAMIVGEKDLDGLICLHGSAIAYVFELLEGFVQGGLAVGMRGDISLRAGIATLKAAAELVKERGVHPAALKDAVCTPGGTTIAGCRTLLEKGFKSAFIEALVETDKVSKAGAAAFRAAKKQ